MPTLRHRLAALIGALAVVSSVFLLGGAAQAQTGYPPGTTTLPVCDVGNVNVGNVSVGQTVTITLRGGFAPGATVTVTVNGMTTLTQTGNGCFVVVVITVTADAVCGTNTVVATGPRVGGGTGSSNGTFNLVCTSTTTTEEGLAFTGANVLRAVLIALALIVIGALLVFFQRRRRQSI